MTPDTAYHVIILFLSLSITVKGLEMCAIRAQFTRGGAMDWRIVGPGWLRASPMSRIAARLYDDRGMTLLSICAVLVSIALFALPPSHTALKAIGAAVVVLHVVYYYRQDFGTDGADQISFVIALTVFACFVITANTTLMEIGLWFIAGQLLLAFTASGVSKLLSPSWRSGVAVRGVLTTYSYGNTVTRRVLPRDRWACPLLCWATIVGECLFPLAVLLDGHWLAGALLAGLAFHIVIAVIMGLNAFVWAFGAAYPAAYYVGSIL